MACWAFCSGKGETMGTSQILSVDGRMRRQRRRAVRRRAVRALTALALCAGLLAAPALAQGEAPPLSRKAKQKTEVVLLGTAGGPAVYPARAEPASLVVVEGRLYLVDVGYGAVRRLVEAGFSPADIAAVFITHQHLDHTSDLPALLSYAWAGGRQAPIEVFGPLGTERLVKAAADVLAVAAEAFGPQMPLTAAPGSLMRAHEIVQAGAVHKDKWVTVTAAENSHYVVRDTLPGMGADKSFAYRFKTRDRVIVFTGDTGPSEAVERLARRADLLVSEVIDLADMRRQFDAAAQAQGAGAPSPEALKPLLDHLEREHLPADALGQLAARAKVKAVVLTHIVASPGNPALVEAMRAEVERYFSGPVYAGKDLDRF